MRRILEEDEVGNGSVKLSVEVGEQNTDWYIDITSVDGVTATIALSDDLDAELMYRELVGRTQNIY